MPRIALISDIHSNLPALQAVLGDIDGQQVDAIYCLGDVVGYGPRPIETLDRVMDVVRHDRSIAGNHDHAVINQPIGFNRSAREAILWTQEILRPPWWALGRRRNRWRWLATRPTSFTEGDVLYVHASPRQHLEEYLLEEFTRGMSMTGEDPQRILDENFALVPRLCFIGHTHRPGVIEAEGQQWRSLTDLGLHYETGPGKAIINIGSVGQPRDGDPRACYAIFDGSSVWWRRVAYDIEQVRREILDHPRLENRQGDRLLQGK
jgi:predicted phosphodiesterase